MICDSICDAMLEAELEELGGRGDSMVAAHLRECLTCRTMAAQLVRETERLALAVRTRSVAPPPHTRRYSGARIVGVAALVGAAAGVMVLVRPSPEPPPATKTAVVVAPRLAVAEPPPVPESSRPGRTARRARPRPSVQAVPVGAAIRSDPFIAERTAAVPTARPAAVMPVRLDPGPVPEPLGTGVRVDLPAGQSATILPTDRRDVTVVWIHSSRTQQ